MSGLSTRFEYNSLGSFGDWCDPPLAASTGVVTPYRVQIAPLVESVATSFVWGASYSGASPDVVYSVGLDRIAAQSLTIFYNYGSPVPQYRDVMYTHYKVELVVQADSVADRYLLLDWEDHPELTDPTPGETAMRRYGFWDTDWYDDAPRLELSLPPQGDIMVVVTAWLPHTNPQVSWSTSISVPSWLTWEGFSAVPLPSEDEQFQDEQRGFWRRILDFLEGIVQSIRDLGEFIRSIPSLIGDLLKSLFVPDPEAVHAVIADFKLFVEGHLGFVLQVDDLFGSFVKPLIDKGGERDIILYLPAVNLPAFAGGRELWGQQVFNVTQMIDQITPLKVFYLMYRVFATVLLFGLLLRYLYDTAAFVFGETVVSAAEDTN